MDLTWINQYIGWLNHLDYQSHPHSHHLWEITASQTRALYMHCLLSSPPPKLVNIIISCISELKMEAFVTQLVAEPGCTARPDQHSQSLFTSSLSLDSGREKAFLLCLVHKDCVTQHDALLGFQNEASNLIHWDRPCFSHNTESLLFLFRRKAPGHACLWARSTCEGRLFDLPLGCVEKSNGKIQLTHLDLFKSWYISNSEYF